MDFDDLLMNTVRAAPRAPRRARALPQRFEHILVDEYQDTNQAQNEIVLLLAGGHRNVTVVGDTDQSVYRFRGADFRNILQFEEAFPDVTTVVLDQNYRSTQTILDAANAVIANNPSRKPKNLWTDAGAGDRIVRYHAEDEGDEARWSPPRPASCTTSDATNWREMAVLLPHQRPEPGGRGGADAPRRAVQGRRRHPLLRPPRGQGRDGLPAGGRQPGRRGQRQAGAQRAQARRRRRQRRQARRATPPATGIALRRGAAPRRRGRASPGRRVRGIDVVRRLLDRLAGRPQPPAMPTAGPADVLQAALERLRLPGRAGGRGHRRGGRTRSRTSASWSARPASSPASTSSSSRSRWSPTPTTCPTASRRPGRADDAALGQGPRVPGRVPHRRRGGRVPAHPGARPSPTSWRRSAAWPTSASPAPASGCTSPTPGAAACSARRSTTRRRGSSTRSRPSWSSRRATSPAAARTAARACGRATTWARRRRTAVAVARDDADDRSARRPPRARRRGGAGRRPARAPSPATPTTSGCASATTSSTRRSARA